MPGFTAQMLATRTIPDKCQSQVRTPARQRSKSFEQFLDALRGIQTSNKQHEFGVAVHAELRARGAPVSQVKNARIASIPNRPDSGGADAHIEGALAKVLALGYDIRSPLHGKARQPSGSGVSKTIQVRANGADHG